MSQGQWWLRPEGYVETKMAPETRSHLSDNTRLPLVRPPLLDLSPSSARDQEIQYLQAEVRNVAAADGRVGPSQKRAIERRIEAGEERVGRTDANRSCVSHVEGHSISKVRTTPHRA